MILYYCYEKLLITFSAYEQIEIIKNEMGEYESFWFGATWNSTKGDYLSDKGKIKVLREPREP